MIPTQNCHHRNVIRAQEYKQVASRPFKLAFHLRVMLLVSSSFFSSKSREREEKRNTKQISYFNEMHLINLTVSFHLKVDVLGPQVASSRQHHLDVLFFLWHLHHDSFFTCACRVYGEGRRMMMMMMMKKKGFPREKRALCVFRVLRRVQNERSETNETTEKTTQREWV